MRTQTRDIPGSPEFFAEMQERAVDAFAAFVEANQRILQELVELSATGAKEGVRAYTELQSAAIGALRDGQASAASHRAAGEERQSNPFAWYQKSLLTAADGTQTAMKLFESNAQVLMRGAERFQAAAEKSGTHVEETLTSYMSRMKEIYATS